MLSTGLTDDKILLSARFPGWRQTYCHEQCSKHYDYTKPAPEKRETQRHPALRQSHHVKRSNKSILFLHQKRLSLIFLTFLRGHLTLRVAGCRVRVGCNRAIVIGPFRYNISLLICATGPYQDRPQVCSSDSSWGKSRLLPCPYTPCSLDRMASSRYKIGWVAREERKPPWKCQILRLIVPILGPRRCERGPDPFRLSLSHTLASLPTEYMPALSLSTAPISLSQLVAVGNS